MYSKRFVKTVYFLISISTALLLIIFGSLGFFIESCNIDAWFRVATSLAGDSPMVSVTFIWLSLLATSLGTMAIALKTSGADRRIIAAWSVVNIVLLIIIRSVELGSNC